MFAEFHDYVRLGEVSGVFLVRDNGKAVISFGAMPESDLPPAITDAEHLRHHQGHVFSIYKSGNYPVYAVVSASQNFVFKYWLCYALILGILGGLMTLALALVFRHNKRHTNLLQGELWQAIDNNDLCVHYQPIMDLQTLRCVGAEALIRWQHPERGMIPPLAFIPLAGKTGMIRHITDWLIERIDYELAFLLGGNPELHVSINLSPADLGADGNKVALDDLLFKHIAHRQIIYEITEHSLIPEQVQTVHEIMAALRETGAKLSLDDFGTGYSSLSYLQRFPLDYLKIDKAFVDGITSATQSGGLIDHIIDIAGTMHFALIAEGVEHDYQMQYLKAHGVQFGQGWHFAKPLPLEAFVAFIEKTNAG